MHITKKKYPTIWCYLFTFFVIFVSDDTLLFGSNNDYFWIQQRNRLYFVFLFLFFVAFLAKRVAIKRNEALSLFCLLFFMFGSALFNRDMRAGVLYLILLMIIAFLFVKLFNFERFAGCFSDIMNVVCLFSCLIYVICIFKYNLLAIFPIVTNSVGQRFIYVFLTAIGEKNYLGLVRNMAFFREPGVFQTYIIFSLSLELFYFNRIRLKRLCIFVASLITTFSTTGYIAGGIIVFAFLLKKYRSNKTKSLKILIILMGTIVLGVVSIYTDYLSFSGPVFSKLFEKNNPSSIARLGTILVDLNIIRESPIWGVGLTRLSIDFPIVAERLLERGGLVDNTNTILFQFALSGIPYGILVCVFYWRFLSYFTQKSICIIYAFLLLLVLFVGENFSFSIMNYVIIMYGLQAVERRPISDENSMVV